MGRNNSENCRVVVRIRPLNSKEKQDGRKVIASARPDRNEIVLSNPSAEGGNDQSKSFTFDAVFPPEITQKQVYDGAASKIVDAVLEGFNGTVFAYGQTGAGKSHTMEGYNEPPDLRGIIPNSFIHIFERVREDTAKTYLIRASYLEIYNEEIRDLLAKDPKNHLELKENVDTGVYVKDLTSLVVKNATEIDQVLQAGKKNRSIGATLMNQTSSRSHSMFNIVIESVSEGLDGEAHICAGKLNLVDLAGSERQSKTGATGDRLKEATKINLSLSALGNVISALVDGRSQHIPYRDSKLTRLLQDSLGGNAKTVMIANCGPADYNFDESLSTLRYANRAKNIKNKPKINEDPKDAMLREYQEEIMRLKAEIAAKGQGHTGDFASTQVRGSSLVKKQIQVKEKVVEKVVVKVEGISEEEFKAMEAKALKEKSELKSMTDQQLEKLQKQQRKSEKDRKSLELKLKKEAEEKIALEEEQLKLNQTIKEMEDKLLEDSKLRTKRKEQEAELEKFNFELQQKRRQEEDLARELAEREEANLNMEEQYSSLQEEVDTKTKKLKKLWTKLKSINQDVSEMQASFQEEREEMLDVIRQLNRQILLKETLAQHFVPTEESVKVEKHWAWQESSAEWTFQRSAPIPYPVRPTSVRGVWRPESKIARSARLRGTGKTRFRMENICDLPIDMPERTTKDYDGESMIGIVPEASESITMFSDMTLDTPNGPPLLNEGAASKRNSGSKTRYPN